MFETDNELIRFALSSWANKIETGNANLSRQDIIERTSSPGGKSNYTAKEVRMMGKMRVLEGYQLELVERIRYLMERY